MAQDVVVICLFIANMALLPFVVKYTIKEIRMLSQGGDDFDH